MSRRRFSRFSLPVLLFALLATVGALIATFGVAMTDVAALPNAIFSENFNAMNPGQTGTQADTGLTVGAWGSATGWTHSGVNTIHNVDLDVGLATDHAVTFFQDNQMTLDVGFAANENGTSYTVSVDVGPSVWADTSEASNASDGLVIDVFRADNTILFSSTQIAGAWNGTASAQNLTTRKFSYVGDGSGVVRLKISTIFRSANRFGGAIDNIRVEQSSTACDPTSTTSEGNTILQFTTVGTCNWTAPAGITSVEALLVGGGGGGGGDLGGGGGGGQVVSTNVSVSGSTQIVVGAGGVFGWNRMYNHSSSGKTGGRSSIGSSALALGGSGGNGRYSNNLNRDGSAINTGFTGGGGAYEDCDECRRANTGTGGAAFKGGDGSGNGSGGGGGAGGTGGARLNGAPGTAVGGIGVAHSLSGVSVTYGGGGGGGGYGSEGGLGGLGGGGKGTNGSASDGDLGVPGIDGLGGGGGGAASDGSEWGHGGMGGSGIVIMKFGTPAPTTTTSTIAPATTTTAPATTITSPVATTTTVKAAVTIDIQAPTNTVAQGQASVATIAPGAAPASVSPLTTVVASNVVTSSTTTTTLAPVQQSSITLAPPSIPKVGTGESSLDLGGVKEKVAITRENNQIVIQSGALSARLSGLGKNGATSPLDKDGNLQLEPGDVIRINVGGFKPGSDVDVWFFSTPTHLGSTKVGADGSVSGAFTVPAKIEDGSHRIAVTAKLENGKQATFTLGVRVGAIPKTSTLTRILIAIPIALAIGAGLILPNQIRRRRRLHS